VEHSTVAGAEQGTHEASDGFRHEAFLYGGLEEFLHGTAAFIRDGITAGEPTLVAVSAEKISPLRDELGADAGHVQFADMGNVGDNPARIIPAWHDFVAERSAPDRAVRGIGEPVTADLGPAWLAECQRHESLLNLAFADAPAFWLICPYDTESLDDAVIEEALRSHPVTSENGDRAESALYGGIEAASAQFCDPLPEPVPRPKELYFEAASLAALRQYVLLRATTAGLDAHTDDLLLAVNEVATNSLRHARGWGVLRIWEEPHALVCEVRDGGSFDEPLAGRVRPRPAQLGGYGLWVANQVCDLVQIRSVTGGSVVRLQMRRR